MKKKAKADTSEMTLPAAVWVWRDDEDPSTMHAIEVVFRTVKRPGRDEVEVMTNKPVPNALYYAHVLP